MPIDHPAGAIREIQWLPETAAALTESPTTYENQVQRLGGQRRRAVVTLAPLSVADAKAWMAFFLKLDGPVGTFYLSDTTGQNPTLTRGTPLVNGGGQSGKHLVTDGWTASTTVLSAGEWVSLRDKLYTVLEDVTSNSAGQATLTLWPAVTDSPLDNDAIEADAPRGIFRLESTPPFGWTINRLLEGVKFTVVEARRTQLTLTERETTELDTTTTGWAETDMDVTVVGEELEFAANNAPSPGTADLTVTLPASGLDFIIYFEGLRFDASATSTINVGLFDGTNFRMGLACNYNGAAIESTRLSVRGRKGTTNNFNAGPLVTSATTIALHFDVKYGYVNFYEWDAALKEWKKWGTAEADAVHTATTFRVGTGGADSAKFYVKRVLVCKPNILTVGSSLYAGHNFHDPDPTYYAGDDSTTNTWQRYLLDLTREKLLNTLPVIRAEGSKNQVEVNTLLSTGLVDCDSPPIVFLGVSAKGYADGYTLVEQAAHVDDGAKLAKDKGAVVTVTNTSYYGPAHVNHPTGTDWERDAWNDHILFINNADLLVDAQEDIRDANDESTGTYFESDDAHPNAAGYAKIGEKVREKWHEVFEVVT